jgi:uncharacterized membrane protein
MLALFAFTLILWQSILRFETYNAAKLDLGNMTQSIWSSTQGSPLMYTSVDGPKSRLAGPMEVIFFAIAPIYALFPDPRVLLIIQTAVFVAGSIPVYLLANRKLGNHKLAMALSATYLFFPVAQTAVIFDFHGDTFAMVFLLFAIEALDRRSKTAFVIWSLLALACKFYVVFALLLISGLAWLSKRRGFAMRGLLIAAGWLVLTYISHQHFGKLNVVQAQEPALARYASYYFGSLSSLPSSAGLRMLSAIIVFGPALILALRSPLWLLAGLAMAAPAMLSSGPGPAYLYLYHHYALTVPFLMVAMIDGAARLPLHATSDSGSGRWSRTSSVILTLGITLTFSLAFVQQPLSPKFYLEGFPGRLDRPAEGKTSRDRLIDQWLEANVPESASIASDVFLAPHLANRSTLYPLFLSDGGDSLTSDRLAKIFDLVDYVVIDIFSELFRTEILRQSLIAEDLQLVESRDGLLLFSKSSSGLAQEVQVMRGADANSAIPIRLTDAVGVVGYNVEVSVDGRLKLTIDWVRLSPEAVDAELVAVSEFPDIANSRIVHLPTFALHPLSAWEMKTIIRETIEFPLPDDLPASASELHLQLYASIGNSLRQSYEIGPVGQALRISLPDR